VTPLLECSMSGIGKGEKGRSKSLMSRAPLDRHGWPGPGGRNQEKRLGVVVRRGHRKQGSKRVEVPEGFYEERKEKGQKVTARGPFGLGRRKVSHRVLSRSSQGGC